MIQLGKGLSIDKVTLSSSHLPSIVDAQMGLISRQVRDHLNEFSLKDGEVVTVKILIELDQE